MESYHNKIEIKNKYIKRLQFHKKADEIRKGVYWQDGKGCAVGCTIHSSNHSAYETELGLPTWLAKLEDKIFEGLPNDEAKEFPLKFLSAIPVGVSNFEEVKWKFLSFILKELINKVPKYKISKERKAKTLKVLKGSLKVLTNAIKTGKVDIKQAELARSAAANAAYAAAAADAAAAAAYAAAAADAAADAAAYADAAAGAAADAADAAAADAAAYATTAAAAARQKAYKKYADELLRLLKGMK